MIDRGKKGKRTAQHQPHDQKRHQTPLGKMHIIPIPYPRLRLRARLPLLPLPLRIPLRQHPRSEMLNQILDDAPRLREHEGRVARGRLDGHDGDLADRVHGFETGGREHGFALVGLEGVGEVEFFEEPEDALGAGFFEPRGVSGGREGEGEGG